MRKAILVMLLIIASNGAMAEWEAIGTSSNGVVTYAEPSTIRRSGDMVKMWSLYDYKTAGVVNGKLYLSIKAQDEYDCKDERSRTIYGSYHSGNMGRDGSHSRTNRPDDIWTPIPPGSAIELLWKIACGK